MRRILIGTAFLMLAAPGWAGVHRWTAVGPEGGRVSRVLPVPSAPDVVWALVSNRPFRSSDGGATWVERSAGLPFPTILPTEELLVDPTQPDTLLAAAFGAEVYRTVDAGVSWSRVVDRYALSSKVELHADPFSAGVLYVAPSSASLRVLRSTDHGATWAAFGTAPAPGLNNYVEHFALDPATAGRWYAVVYNTGTNRLLVSTDSGTSWVQRGSGLPTQFRELVVAATSPPTLWLYSTGSGLYRSTDGGTTFSKSGLGRTDVRIIAVDPGDPRTVYGVRDDAFPTAMFRSTDSGATWDEIGVHATGLPTASLAAVAVDPSDATHLWAGTSDDGVLESTDRGVSWSPTNAGLPRDRSVCTLAVPPGGTTLYAVAGRALWTSRDGGESWIPGSPEVAPGPPFPKIDGVALDPTDLDVLYAASPSGVFKSVDGGQSWSPTGAGLPVSGARMVAVDPLAPLTLYATTASGVYRSLDGGASWALRGPGSFSNLTIDPTLPSTIYFDGGLAVSRDGGASSAPPGLFDPYVGEPAVISLLGTVAPAPTSPGKVYAGLAATALVGNTFWNASQLNVSGDRLATYAVLSASVAPTALAVDPTDDLSLYVGRPEGARRSRDGGTTLSPFDAGLRGTPCTFAGGRPGEPLYAGTMQTDSTRPSFGVYAIEEPACSTDPDCEDGSDCTNDHCSSGRCVHDAVANGTACGTPEAACVEAGSCRDGTCTSFHGCDDRDSCTTDLCVLPGSCEHERIDGCCSSAADCDDGDACTTDTCSASHCVSTVDFSMCSDRRVASATIRIVSRPGGAKITFESSDPALAVPAVGGADDPSLNGATVEIFRAAATSTTSTVPAGTGRPGWKVGATPGMPFLYVNPAAPAGPSAVRRLALRARPQLRLTAFPAVDPIAVAPPSELGIRITMGGIRVCALFGGSAIRRSGPGLFVARGTMLPVGDCDATHLGAGAP